MTKPSVNENNNKLYIFDLDHTLLAADSNVLWNQFLLENNLIEDTLFPEQEQQFIQDYLNGCMDIHRYIQFTMQPLCHLSVAEIDNLAWQCVDSHILPQLYPQARALLTQLQQQDIPLIIISATVSFLVEKIAARLGVQHAIGIDLLVDGQHYQAKIAGIPSYQQGKIDRLQQWLQRYPMFDGERYFYTDSINDLPMCQYANHVYLVNPCEKLRQHNQQTHWPVLHWQ